MEKYIKPVIPLWKVLLFSLGFFGVQLVVMIFAITTPQFFGDFANQGNLSDYMWLAIPLIGIFIQPLVGFVGDHLWGAYGRRGFFILLASSFGAVSIFMIAFSTNMVVALIFLFVAIVSVNTLIVSYRAMTCEMTPPQERVAGYGMLTALQLLGMLGAILIKYWVGGEGQTIDIYSGDFPPYVSALMIIGAVVLLITAFFGTTFLREYPTLGYKRYISYVPFTSNCEEDLVEKGQISYLRQGAMWLSVMVLTLLVFVSSDFLPEAYAIPLVMFGFAILLMITHVLNKSRCFLSMNQRRFVELMTDVMNMPLVMKKLNLMMLFAWFGVFLFLGNLPGIIIQNGNIMTSMLGFNSVMASYIYTTVVAIVFTPVIILSARREHLGHWLSAAIFAMAIALLGYYYYQTMVSFILILTILGVLTSVLYTIPYAILSYNLPSRRVGVFFGLFNIFVIVPYILVPSVSRSFVESMLGVHYQTVIMSVVALMFALIVSLIITKKEYE